MPMGCRALIFRIPRPMDTRTRPAHFPSVCPHDCQSACALKVEVDTGPDGLARIGRVHGGDLPYTDGIVCAKVARYAERVHHPDRLTTPLRRTGAKGSGQFEALSWDAALDLVAENFSRAIAAHGAETVWPYHQRGRLLPATRDILRGAGRRGLARRRWRKARDGFARAQRVRPDRDLGRQPCSHTSEPHELGAESPSRA